MLKSEFVERFQHIVTIPNAPDFPLRRQGKPAAVLIPIVMRDELQVLFTKRATHLKHHAGQVSFPGGRWETSDESLIHTALRETEEEIGISPDKVEILGRLPKFRTISRYEVSPIIGFVEPDFESQIDPNEVDDLFEVPLEFLMNMDNFHVHWVVRSDTAQPVFFVPWQRELIWGATAAFLHTLGTHINKY